MDDRGFVLVWRRFSDSQDPFWTPERKWCWVEIIQLAQHKTWELAGVKLERGEVLLSLEYLTRRWGRWGWTRGKVRWFISSLLERGSLESVRRSGSGTIYRIAKYEEYQRPRKLRSDPVQREKARSGPVQGPFNDTEDNTPQQHPLDGAGSPVIQGELGTGGGCSNTPLATPKTTPRERSKEDVGDAPHPPTTPPFNGNGWRHQFKEALKSHWLLCQFPDGVYPPRSEIAKQDRFCLQIANALDEPEQGIRAVLGIENVFPHAPPRSEPWTPQLMKHKLSMCISAAVDRAEIDRARKVAKWVDS